MAIQKPASMEATHLKAKDLYRLRAMDMLRCRIKGLSRAQIAEEYNCSIDTVERSLTYARREGLVQAYENRVIGDLVPKAIQVYMEKLEEKGGDEFFAAKDVMDKLFKMGDRFQTKETVKEEMGLKQYLAEKAQKESEINNQAPKTVEGKIIDAEYYSGSTNHTSYPLSQQPAETTAAPFDAPIDVESVARQWDDGEDAGDFGPTALPQAVPDENYG